MKKILKWTLGGVLAVLVLFLVVGLFLGTEWEVSRSIVIAAKPAEVQPHVANLSRWGAWSPFEKEDPDIEMTYSGPAEGKGAKAHWVSEKIGNGEMEVLESNPGQGVWVQVRLEGMLPFDGQFVFEPAEGGTLVTWTDWGDFAGTFNGGWFAQMMEPMLGPAFDEGLAALKTAVEAR